MGTCIAESGFMYTIIMLVIHLPFESLECCLRELDISLTKTDVVDLFDKQRILE